MTATTNPPASSPPEYDGKSPFPTAGTGGPPSAGRRMYVTITAVIVIAPFAGLALAIPLLWGSVVRPLDLVLLAVFYVVSGLGVTVGFHRGLTHGSYTAAPALRIALAVAGSLSFQGDVIDWVATHRRHHAFTDRPGDPHSPYRYGTGLRGQLRGLVHSHIGWLFGNDPTSHEHYAPDLLADRGIRAVDRAFPVLCLVTLALPCALGWALGGSWVTGLTALLWAGFIRIALLHHVTWSVNSLCHVIGERPFRTRRHDRATNLWPLALLSFGESWHNLHHADPTCARHGVDRGQIDVSAALIRLFERAGWVWNVRWPDPARLAARRNGAG
ncbi:acyl-CoA desaturase [Streptomyces chattanoogensis]|uniref:Stearoyl-CoA 9-desaturase n=1 Tax=Streptomyces chattanoogensis TaxID=66876 RepID=A0A0N1JWH4_9ACTN|nr:acyl-CoA desaturase [Streptomyces chattanoogensis]KPC59953.1 stearoyl-CoA 9-desaturase [Streptomyces chattanoogensis]